MRPPVEHHHKLGHVGLACNAQHGVQEADVTELRNEMHASHSPLGNNILQNRWHAVSDMTSNGEHAAKHLSQVAAHFQAKHE